MLDSHFLQSLLGAEMDRLGKLTRLETRLHSVAPLERPGVQIKIDVVMNEIAKLTRDIQVYKAAAATNLAKHSQLVEGFRPVPENLRNDDNLPLRALSSRHPRHRARRGLHRPERSGLRERENWEKVLDWIDVYLEHL